MTNQKQVAEAKQPAEPKQATQAKQKSLSFKKLVESGILSQVLGIALDLGKTWIQLYFKHESGEYNIKLQTQKLFEILQSLPKGAAVCFENCGTSHWVGRMCQNLELIPYPFHATDTSALRHTDKSDAADAKAIWSLFEYSKLPGHKVRTSKIKSIDEQACAMTAQSLAQSADKVTACSNALGATLDELLGPEKTRPKERAEQYLCEQARDFITSHVNSLLKEKESYLASLSDKNREKLKVKFQQEAEAQAKAALFDMSILQFKKIIPSAAACIIFNRYFELKQAIQLKAGLDETVKDFVKEHEPCKNLLDIPGVGFVNAFSLYAALSPMLDELESASAAVRYVGMAPHHTGTGGKVVMLGIGHGGLKSLKRSVFQAGMCVVLRHIQCGKDGGTSWILDKLATKHMKTVAGAAGAAIIRVAYAMLKRGTKYNPNKDYHLSWEDLRNPKASPALKKLMEVEARAMCSQPEPGLVLVDSSL